MTRLLGAVLAGGRSSRFGSDKAVALWDGKRLLDRARGLLDPWCDDVVVVGRNGGIADLPGPGLGPLGGIAAALDHGATRGFRCVLTISCDMPRVPKEVFEALLRRGPSYCVEAPVLGHWPAALGAQLLSYLETGPSRSVKAWAQSIGALPIDAEVPIANINTPADLLAL